MTDRDHEEHDGCLCGCDHSEHELTPDIDLPAAVGGVQGDAKPRKPRRKKEKPLAVRQSS